MDEFFFNKEVFLGAKGIVDDLMCRNNNFKYLRRMLGEIIFLEVDDTLRIYEKENIIGCIFIDFFGVEKLSFFFII